MCRIMEARYEILKSWIVNFKLDLCCCLAPLRTGTLIIGYLNVTFACIWLIATADEGFTSVLVQIQNQILEDNATKTIPLLAYAMELAFSVVLLCAIHRNDIPLMRVYLLYCIGSLVMSVMVYSMVMASIGALTCVDLVLNIVFQVYVILLVRSLIVEWKLAAKRLALPTIVYKYPMDEKYHKPEGDYEVPLPQEPESVKIEPSPNAEVKVKPESQDSEETKDDSKHEDDVTVKSETKLETVIECPKEESVNDKK